jgi:SAM-dependent methyltransferase
MLQEEALWLKKELSTFNNNSLNKMLNVGSSTLHFRTVVQSFIDEDIFKPLRKRHIEIINLDLKEDKGVDINGDLLDEAFQDILKTYKFQSVICSNLLEHVPNPQAFGKAIVKIVEKDAKIIVTVPYKYPYHKDPIDTLFRPTVEELASIFPGTRILRSAYVRSDASMIKSMIKNWRFGVLSTLRLMQFYKKDWREYFSYFPNILRKYEVTCVILEKTA